MEDALLEILAAIKQGGQTLDDAWLEKLVRRHNRKTHDAQRTVAKRRLLPYYLQVRNNDPEHWQRWEVDEKTEVALLRLLKMKPRRTASGVATITVITKPWPCSSACLYCPNDVRMPKSYLANEPACQRAEHNFFDPYLQVKSRLHVLEQMGHVTDKVELIVLGGTWNDYPESYQRWFIEELFRAVNDKEPYLGGPEAGRKAGTTARDAADTAGAEGAADAASATGATDGEKNLARKSQELTLDASDDSPAERTAYLHECGLLSDTEALAEVATETQQQVNDGLLSYNQAVSQLAESEPWQRATRIQHASWEAVEEQQRIRSTRVPRDVLWDWSSRRVPTSLRLRAPV